MSNADATLPADPFQRVALAAANGQEPKRAAAAADGLTHVVPAPADAPPPSFEHRQHGRPACPPWAYRDAAGRLLGYVVRFGRPEGGKEVLPRTLWRDADGRLVWKWKGAPQVLRGLYGLDRLAARPDAPVLVVEGEKAADVATVRFPGLVAVTWPGGVGGVRKADWSPLAGRQVVVWPDADDAGREAARIALEGLRRASAAAAQVKLPAGLPEKWDLADDWPAGFGPGDAEAAIQEALQQLGGAVQWPRGYRMEADGLWFDKYTDGKPTPVWLCEPFEILGEARDLEGGGWSLVLRFKDPDGRPKQEIVRRAQLAAAGAEVRSKLADAGLRLSVRRGEAEKFVAALAEVRAGRRLTLIETTGWVTPRCFALPHRVVSAAGGEPVVFTGSANVLHYGQAGALAAWQAEVAGPASGNSLVLFAISLAFAGPLLRPLGLEGGGFHFRGPSSSGKTTLAQAAGSVWGGGGPLGAAQTWRSTANALEMIARAASETLLVLDELALVAAEDAGQAAYSLSSGQAKGRARQDGSLRSRAEWCVMLFSTGEISLADHIRTSRRGDRAMAGQELRLLDITADGGAGLGVWRELHGASGPAALSDAMKSASRAHYGHAGPAFLEHLVANRREAEGMAKELMKSFVREAQRDRDTGQIHRAAHRFAVVAAAGELAIGFGVLPWSEGEAFNAALEVFGRWAEGFGRNAVREEQTVLQVLRGAIEMHQARFARLDDEGPEWDPEDSGAREARALNTLGYLHRQGAEAFYLVHDAGWREIFRGHDLAFAAKAADEAGYLLRGDGKHVKRKKRVQGTARPFYWVRATLLSDDD